MKGYTIKESIDLLEKEIKNAGGGGGTTPTAADVTYDNTSSGLTADDVQEAIDELNTKLTTGHVYSTTEKVIGKWTDGSDLYEKVTIFDTFTTGANSLELGLTNVKEILKMNIMAEVGSGIGYKPVPALYLSAQSLTEYGIACDGYTVSSDTLAVTLGSQRTITKLVVITEYTKTPPTRTKKSKKEE